MNNPGSFFEAESKSKWQKRPTVVFLHGIFGGLGNFAAAAARLQPHFPVFIPMLPVFEPSVCEASLSSLVRWLDQTLETLESKQVVLVGNSLGGQLSCLYTALKPHRVAALVLAGSAGLGERIPGGSKPKRFDPDFLREKVKMTFYDFEPDKELLDYVFTTVRNPESLQRLLQWSRDSSRTDLRHLLQEIDCPTCLIWGKNDVITPPECALAFQKGLSNARTVLLENCGHAPMMEHPELFSEILFEFLHEHFLLKPSEIL